MPKKPKIIVIVGPTASGKSDLAVRVAKKFNCEVISADSRQVYRGLDIGTGKITKREMRGISHHLLDVASPRHRYSVAEYKEDAEKALRSILHRGKIPVICGGTAFYIDALVDGIILPNVRPDDRLRKMLQEKSTEEMYAMLRKLDPKRALSIDHNNPRRLIRAIEIAKELGSVPTLKRAERYDALFIGISVPNAIMRERIHVRLIKRIRIGMIGEAKRLHEQGLSFERMDELGLEYRYLAKYLEGTMSKQEMLEKLEAEIVHYTKRQMTWWKRDKRIHWINIEKTGDAFPFIDEFIKEKTPR